MRSAIIIRSALVLSVLVLGVASYGQDKPARPRPRGDTLKNGEDAPDFALKDFGGQAEVSLANLKGKPVVLIFGSCTCPPFVKSMTQTEKLYDAYKGKAHFYIIYIREAHPTDGRRGRDNDFEVKSPTTDEERRTVAKNFAEQLKVSIPILVDGVDDRVEKAYSSWPNRMCILDAKGNIIDKGAAGPGGVSSSARRAADVLDKLLSAAESEQANEK